MIPPFFRRRFAAALRPSEAGSSAQLCTPKIEPGSVDLVPNKFEIRVPYGCSKFAMSTIPH